MDEEHLINKLSQWSRLHKKKMSMIYSALDSLIQRPNTVLCMSHLINALSSHVIIATTGHMIICSISYWLMLLYFFISYLLQLKASNKACW